MPTTILRRTEDPTPEPPKDPKPIYPEDHQPGMRVPRGGSMCANCEYLKDQNKGLCGQENFIAWHGSEQLPEAINEYCCDWFSPAKALSPDDYDEDGD